MTEFETKQIEMLMVIAKALQEIEENTRSLGSLSDLCIDELGRLTVIAREG